MSQLVFSTKNLTLWNRLALMCLTKDPEVKQEILRALSEINLRAQEVKAGAQSECTVKVNYRFAGYGDVSLHVSEEDVRVQTVVLEQFDRHMQSLKVIREQSLTNFLLRPPFNSWRLVYWIRRIQRTGDARMRAAALKEALLEALSKTLA